MGANQYGPYGGGRLKKVSSLSSADQKYLKQMEKRDAARSTPAYAAKSLKSLQKASKQGRVHFGGMKIGGLPVR